MFWIILKVKNNNIALANTKKVYRNNINLIMSFDNIII